MRATGRLSSLLIASVVCAGGLAWLAGSAAALPAAPDIAVSQTATLSPGFLGRDESSFIGTGQQSLLPIDVQNLGTGSPQTTLTITMPTGLILQPVSVVRLMTSQSLPCTQIAAAPLQYTCPLGAIPHTPGPPANGPGDTTIEISFTTTSNPPVGTSGSITVAAEPDPGQGTDVNLANNALTTPPRKFTGIAAMTSTITPQNVSIPLGQQTRLTVTLHNAGPQPAEDVISVIDLPDLNVSPNGAGPIQAIKFTGNTTPPPSHPPGGFGSNGTTFPAVQVLWFAGTLAVGQTIQAIVTVRARTTGNTRVRATAFSTATDPGCVDIKSCGVSGSAIQAIPAPVQHHPTVAPTPAKTSTAPPTAPSLAATGTPVGTQLVFAALFLFGGAMLMLFRVRRRSTYPTLRR